jgi:glycerophosphoryl diester phosphodiesterase
MDKSDYDATTTKQCKENLTLGSLHSRPFFAHEHALNIAHRGGSALAPENTLTAFAHGIDAGADGIELDLQTTRDGELVVCHDSTVDRTTDGSGAIARYILTELRHLDAGYRFTRDNGKTYPFRGAGIVIPTLREALERFPSIRINIGLKLAQPRREHQLWAILQEYHAVERVLIGSIYPSAKRLRQLTGGQLATSATPGEVFAFFAHPSRVKKPAYDALQIPARLSTLRILTPKTIAAAHRLGIEIHVWTVNNKVEMRHLLDMGVDAIMTDHPDVLNSVLAAL